MSDAIDQDRLDNFRLATAWQELQRENMALKAENAALKQRMEEEEKAEPVGEVVSPSYAGLYDELPIGTLLYLHPVPAKEGYVLVPMEPTEEMRDAGNEIIRDRGKLFAAYSAMLKAYSEAKEK